MSQFFNELLESIQQMDQIQRDECQPSRQFKVDALQVKKLMNANKHAIPTEN